MSGVCKWAYFTEEIYPAAAAEKPAVAVAIAAVAAAVVAVAGDFSGDDREPDLLDQ